jgi:hypothetical protein
MEIVMLSEISRAQKDKFCIFSLICERETILGGGGWARGVRAKGEGDGGCGI